MKEFKIVDTFHAQKLQIFPSQNLTLNFLQRERTLLIDDFDKHRKILQKDFLPTKRTDYQKFFF